MTGKKASPNKSLAYVGLVFLAAYFIPFSSPGVKTAVGGAFVLLGEYAREHVLLCLVPAMFIAGAIMVFLNQQSVIKYLGPEAKKVTAYSVASVSGAVLAVCSCTVLPVFKGIYKKGAGIGPAVAFLYSGPAINILAVILTAKIFGWKLGAARIVGAVLLAVVIGMIMHVLFRKEDNARVKDAGMFRGIPDDGLPLYKQTVFMGAMIGILVFINWANSGGENIIWDTVYRLKYFLAAFFGLVLAFSLFRWFSKDQISMWGVSTRDFALQIFPYIFIGVLFAGFFFGTGNESGIIRSRWISGLVGNNSLGANLIASVTGVLMYFATLTEVPIVQGLMNAGMAKGPALTMLLAGPSLSLPSILVLRAELGTSKTIVYIVLVAVFSSLCGMIFGTYA